MLPYDPCSVRQYGPRSKALEPPLRESQPIPPTQELFGSALMATVRAKLARRWLGMAAIEESCDGKKALRKLSASTKTLSHRPFCRVRTHSPTVTMPV